MNGRKKRRDEKKEGVSRVKDTVVMESTDKIGVAAVEAAHRQKAVTTGQEDSERKKTREERK